MLSYMQDHNGHFFLVILFKYLYQIKHSEHRRQKKTLQQLKDSPKSIALPTSSTYHMLIWYNANCIILRIIILSDWGAVK